MSQYPSRCKTISMNAERFEQIARNPARTRVELESMKANAIAKGEGELARIADEVLRGRFPVQIKRVGGPTPTVAAFRGTSETFPTGKEAYLWLVEQFKFYRPTILDDYQARARTASHRFAKKPEALFPVGSRRAGDPSFYTVLSGGWYADTNLNHADKFAALLQLAHFANLGYPSAWDFRVEGGTKELAAQQQAEMRAKKLLEEFLSGE